MKVDHLPGRPWARPVYCLIAWLMLGPATAWSQSKSIHQFVFGHSLVKWYPDASVPQPHPSSDYFSVPYWVYSLAQASPHTYAIAGQYGFLLDHANNLPPYGGWTHERFDAGYWDAQMGPFAQASFDNVMFTIENFIQDFGGPAELIPWFNQGEDSPLSLSLRILDHVSGSHPAATYYLYENWPSVNPDGSGLSFPVSAGDYAAFHAHVQGAFHQWWLALQDSLLAERPALQVRMIPVGPILAGLLTETPLAALSQTQCYTDGVHGTPSLYFLAGLIQYMALYAEPAPATYQVPAIVEPLITTHYSETVGFIWQALQQFRDTAGHSRVFPAALLPTDEGRSSPGFRLFPNPAQRILYIESDLPAYEIWVTNALGQLIWHQQAPTQLDVSGWPAGSYGVHLRARTQVLSRRILVAP